MRDLRPFSFLLLLTAGCSPIYGYKAAAGHLGLLWRSRSISKTVSDPKTPPDLKAKLEIVEAARAFGFDRMQLRRSRDYLRYSPVDGPAVTYLVSAAPKTRLEPYLWHFPFIGSFPYKGYFALKDARREAERMTQRGFDACVTEAAAYHAPRWLGNPIPSSALDQGAGEIADLLLHELTHGTIWFHDRADFNEALASFFGGQGAKEFLEDRYGPGSPQAGAFARSLKQDRDFAAAIEDLYSELDVLYHGPLPDSEKLRRREEVFRRGRGRLKALGADIGDLNNAEILARRIYADDQDLFEAAYQKQGRDWRRLQAFLKSLDPKDPEAALRRAVENTVR